MEIEFGARFAKDGNTYVDANGDPADAMTDGASFVKEEGGAVYVQCGCKWDGYGYRLSADEVSQLIAFLK